MNSNDYIQNAIQILRDLLLYGDLDDWVVYEISDALRNIRQGIDISEDEILRLQTLVLDPTGDYGVIGWLPDDFDGEGDEDDEDPDADGEDAA